MKSDDNIKNFFEKRLRDTTGAEDGWNIPSDDIWNSAKVHFPKKKKKNRPFFYFLFGAGTMLLLTLSVGYFFFTVNEKDSIVETVAPIVLNDETQEVKKEIDLASSEKVVPAIESISGKEKEENNSTINSTKITKEESTKDKINFTQVSSQKTFNATSTTKKEEDFLTENATAKKKENKQTTIIESPNIIDQNKIKTAENSLPVTSKKASNISINNVIDLPSLISEIENKQRPISNNSKVIKIKSRRKINRWEVGLSHAPLILLPLVKADLKDDEEVEIDIKYRNLNGVISRRLNRRFSVTSGMMLSSLDVGIGFELDEVYEMNRVDVNFKGILPDNPSGGTLSINDESSDIDVVFSPDANLMNGDSVLVKGYVPLEFKAIQIPFLLNYHFGKGKFEGLVHAGFSVDYYNFKIRNIDFDVYKENVLISESVNFEPINDAFFGISAYLGAGVKYHLNDRINVGLSMKFDATDLIFSRYEFGVYYGF